MTQRNSQFGWLFVAILAQAEGREAAVDPEGEKLHRNPW